MAFSFKRKYEIKVNTKEKICKENMTKRKKENK